MAVPNMDVVFAAVSFFEADFLAGVDSDLFYILVSASNLAGSTNVDCILTCEVE